MEEKRAVSQKIGVLDVDGNGFPNLALMKVSAYHKQRGDFVEIFNGLRKYDLVYVAKVFSDDYSADYPYAIQADKVVRGGTGYSLDIKLPDDVEHIYPDYSLYDIRDMAYGYITRGCPRQCGFCIVAEKEGSRSVQVAELGEFWRGQKKIVLLDPNILACESAEALLAELADTNAEVDFTQGLDVRMLDTHRARLLQRIKSKKISFAWDNPRDSSVFNSLKTLPPDVLRKAQVYILTNFNSTLEEDLMRVYAVRDIGAKPYVMIYDKPHAPHDIKRLQRFCNNKWIFNSCEKFEDYGHFRTALTAARKWQEGKKND